MVVSPRFELFLALAAVLGPDRDGPPWLRQARRKLDPAARRRMGDLARAPSFWPALAAVPGDAALDSDTDAVIGALADLPVDEFAERCAAALLRAEADPALARLAERLAADPGGLQQAAADALRRFDRLAFAALWRRAAPDLVSAARGAPAARADAPVFPTLFGAHRFQLGRWTAQTIPVDRLLAAAPTAAALPSPADPEAVFRALGDATRYAIARLIARTPMTGATLARTLGVSGPTLTHHLKELRRAKLVIEQPTGNSILLSLDRGAIAALSAAALDGLFTNAAPVAIRRSRRS